MPANVSYEYENAEQTFHEANSPEEKLKALQLMYSSLNKHKGNEKLQKEIKNKIAKYKDLIAKEKKVGKSGKKSLSIKKEGAARVVLLGKTNSGKSYLLSKITNAKPIIADYEFTTKKPEVGTMDYEGVKIQAIEIPAIVKNFAETDKGPTYLGIVREADLVIIVNRKDEKFIKKEMEFVGIRFNGMLVDSNMEPYSLKNEIWRRLGLIYVYTKSPGKNKDYPPVALKKGDSVKELARKVHKDFLKKFNFAKIWGDSAKFEGQQVGLNHKLKSRDVVEIHVK